jgi:hypothetical protein
MWEITTPLLRHASPLSATLRLGWSPLRLPISAAPYELPNNVALITLQTGQFLGSPLDAILLRLAHTCGHPSPAEDCGAEAGGKASVSICKLLSQPAGRISITETTVTANRALADTERLRFQTEKLPLCFKQSCSDCPGPYKAESSLQSGESVAGAPAGGSHDRNPPRGAANGWHERWKNKLVDCGGEEEQFVLQSLEVRTFVVYVNT